MVWWPWSSKCASATSLPPPLVGLCSLANFINSADRVIMPVAIVGLSREFGYSLHQQAWVLSAFPAGYISSQVVRRVVGVVFRILESFRRSL